MVHNCLVKILLLESRKNLVGILKDLFRWLYKDWKTLQVTWLQLDSNPQPLISYLEISGKFFISSASYFFVSKWKSVQFGVLSFVGYLMERVIACLCLERFNFTNFHLPFFVRFLDVIACGTKSEWLSPSSLSLPLSVAKCCRFFLNVLSADYFFCFLFDDLGCLSSEPVIKNLYDIPSFTGNYI